MEVAWAIMEVLEDHEILVVPGGGPFADEVRAEYKKGELSKEAAHKQAIEVMDQYGLYLSDVSGMGTTLDPLEKTLPKILLPSSFFSDNDPFEPSWDVTSDTIACHVAHLRDEDEFLILTDVEGVMVKGEVIKEMWADEVEAMGETCVDRALPGYMKHYGMDCLVVNGMDLERIKGALSGENPGTLIKVK